MMNQEELISEIGVAVKASMNDGVKIAAQMARDMADQMASGALPQMSAPIALQLLADLLLRVENAP